MSTRLYIEALLVDVTQADAVWQLWIDDEIDDAMSSILWLLIALRM